MFSMTIGNKNTYNDWFLVPSSRPVIPPPEPNENFLEIPGINGSLNLSSLLTGYPTFKDRTGSQEFLVTNQDISWTELYSNIMWHLNGKEHEMILNTDPDYIYKGQFKVDSWETPKDWSRITISYTLNPYKFYKLKVSEQYPDVFNWKSIIGTTELIPDLYKYVDRMPVNPFITVRENNGGSMTFEFINTELGINTGKFMLPTGISKTPRVTLSNFTGNNTMSLKVTGTGTVFLDYQNGRL